jgi:hypothetical protein
MVVLLLLALLPPLCVLGLLMIVPQPIGLAAFLGLFVGSLIAGVLAICWLYLYWVPLVVRED